MSTVKKTNQFLLKQYHDLNNPVGYGGVSRFAKTQGISLKWAKAILENNLGYTLHKPQCRTFPTLPVKVFMMNEQWTADLIEVINIAKQNKGVKYLLAVLDVKNKTGKTVTEAFKKILKQGRKPIQLQTDDGK